MVKKKQKVITDKTKYNIQSNLSLIGNTDDPAIVINTSWTYILKWCSGEPSSSTLYVYILLIQIGSLLSRIFKLEDSEKPHGAISGEKGACQTTKCYVIMKNEWVYYCNKAIE